MKTPPPDSTKLGGIVVDHHGFCAKRLDRGLLLIGDGALDRLGVVQAVHKDAVRRCRRAADMDIVPPASDGSRQQGGKTHRVAHSSDAGDVDRKLIQVPRGDLGVVLCAIGLEQRSIRRYRNCRRGLPHRQLQVDSRRLSNRNRDSIADQLAKARCNHRNGILARGQLRDRIVSRASRNGRVLRAHRGIGDGYLGPRYCGA